MVKFDAAINFFTKAAFCSACEVFKISATEANGGTAKLLINKLESNLDGGCLE